MKPVLTVHSFNLREAERALCVAALHETGSIGEAAQGLGLTRHALARRITKHRIEWPRRPAPEEVEDAHGG